MIVTQNTEVQAYIDDVCSQIRFREAHREIRLELATHIQEIVQEYMSEGYSEQEAVNRAITQMGGADIVGKQLNRVHKPKPEWSILTLSLLFVSLGLLAMFLIEKQGLFTSGSIPIFTKSLIFTIIGAGMVIGLYLFDYRKLEPYSKHIYLGAALLLLIVVITGQTVNGKQYLRIGPIYFDLVGISPFLFSIALAGIINKWNWNEHKRLLKGLLLCVVPLALILASGSLSAGVIYSITCITLIIVSRAGHRVFLSLIGLVSGMLMLSIISAPYKLQRLIIFINPEKDPSGSGWLNIQLSKLINSSGFYGQGLTLKPKTMPDLHTDFIFSYITFTFGWIAGVVLAAMIVMFILRITRIVTVVKNNYAKLLISGFVTIFAVQFIWNIFMNLGFAPISGVGLPFISFGGSQLIFNAAALGLVSSIYRRRNISKTLISS